MPQKTIDSFFSGRGPSSASPHQPSSRRPPQSPSPSPPQNTEMDTDMDIDSLETEEPSQTVTWSRSEPDSQSCHANKSRHFASPPPPPTSTILPLSLPSSSSSPSSSSTPRSGHKKVKQKFKQPYDPGPRGTSSSRGAYRSQSLSPGQKAETMPYRKNNDLASVAQETLDVLPGILGQLPHVFADKAHLFRLPNLAPLNPDDNPKFVPPGGAAPRTAVRVINADTYDAALELPSRIEQEDREWATRSFANTQASPAKTAGSTSSALYGRVAVLNFASNFVPGGGWLKGARAQEEALCYRSSLYLSLDKQFYPLRQLNGIYTPDVVVIRSSMDNGHELLHPDPVTDPSDLPVVSVISVAALRRPPLKKIHCGDGSTKELFEKDADRELTKAKMRLTLRIAGMMNHGLVVLGALGCGAFRNPPEEVASCWAEVVREPEFIGGRFRELCFAVWDKKNEGNLEIFKKTLDGLQL